MNGSKPVGSRTGWIVTVAGFAINVLVGIPYTWSLFSQALVHQHGWLHSTAAAPYSMYLFTYALSMVPAGHLQDRFGPRGVVLLGAVLAGAGFVLSGVWMTTPAVIGLWGILVGSGMACCFAAVTPAAMSWFPDARHGLISGIVVTGVGISAFVLAPAVSALVGRGVRLTFVVCGITLWAGIGFLSTQVRAAPDGARRRESATAAIATVRSAAFVRFWLTFLCMTAAGVTVVTHVTEIMRVHTGVHRAALSVAIFAGSNGLGRIAGGALADRLGRSTAIQVVIGGLLAGLVGMLAAAEPTLMLASISVIGLSYGAIFGVFPAATAEFFGPESFGLKYGIVFSAIAVSGTFPWLAGLLFERFASFTPALLVLVAMCVVALGLSRTLPGRENR
ncbi:MAG: MFS transporter [Spirochaetaceae bacterium]|nr:MAG: MFS transporter [Spirochaetaceae bacterium]